MKKIIPITSVFIVAIIMPFPLEANSNTIKCDGKTDDTKAIQYAVKNYKNIMIPEGTCIVSKSITLPLKVNVYASSVNDTQIVQTGSPPEANSLFTLLPGSSGTTIKNITLKGMSQTKELTEHQHLIKLMGVSDVTLENMVFKEFRGDGIYIGTGKKFINENILISKNIFDGVNNNNRNAISIISGKNIKIINNQFSNTTKDKMPGAIDLEPNNPVDIIEDIIITKNKFSNIGGYAAISIYFSDKASIKPSSYTIIENTIDTKKNTKSIAFRDVRKLKKTQDWDKLSIYNNTLSSKVSDKIYISGIKHTKSKIENQPTNH